MNKVLLIAALTMVSASAFASKARLNALQGAAHLVDFQNGFSQPWQTSESGELATVEFGTANGTTAHAEGGFVRQWNDSYLGVYLGHNDIGLANRITFTDVSATGAAISTARVFGANNPLNISYNAKSGDMSWGLNFGYIASDMKNSANLTAETTTANAFTNRKFNQMNLALGATNGTWDASLNLGLSGKGNFTPTDANTFMGIAGGTGAALTANAEHTYTAKTAATLQGGYKVDTLYYYGSYTMAGGKLERAGTELADLSSTAIKLGVVNSHKKDGTDFFYGIAASQTVIENKTSPGAKTEATKLPVIVGVEAEANSWIVLRGSLTQSLPVLGSTKVTTGGTAADTDTADNDTTVALGSGFKLNKFTLDAVLTAGTSGGLSATDFGSQASVTYLF